MIKGVKDVKKIKDIIARDLWIVLLDILAVNLSYFLALLVRFYVNFEFRPTVTYYLTDWLHFTPFYTILCIIVFALFKLYGGMWRFAGINDMNRIIGANAVTTLIQIVGTALFIRRMPITYYVIGAILQFLFLSLIRFGYRILLVEKKKVASKNSPAIPTLIIGAGETGRKAINHLEESTAFRPVVVVDKKNAGKTLNGIPVVEDLDKALQKAQAVFVADPTLDAKERKAIKEKTESLNLELQDYTGYLSNLGGKVPLASLLELTNGIVSVTVDGQENKYESGEAALKALTGRYEVAAISDLKVELKKPNTIAYAGYEAWAQQHKEETGEDISFF